MKAKKKVIPKFLDEDEERAFWTNHDSSEFVDWSRATKAKFPSLRPSLKSVSIRLPESMIEQLKVVANKKDVPYQSLMKIYLSEKLKDEQKAKGK